MQIHPAGDIILTRQSAPAGPAMNAFRAILALLLATVLGPDLRAEDWTTTDGKVYKDVIVVKVEDDAVTILDHDGGALVPLAKLAPALQAKFHYDPARAQAAAAARAQVDGASATAFAAEKVQAQKLQAARDARYAADKKVVEDAKAAAQGPADSLGAGRFGPGVPSDPSHHTVGDIAGHLSLEPPPDPGHRSVPEAFAQHDPDMPAMGKSPGPLSSVAPGPAPKPGAGSSTNQPGRPAAP